MGSQHWKETGTDPPLLSDIHISLDGVKALSDDVRDNSCVGLLRYQSTYFFLTPNQFGASERTVVEPFKQGQDKSTLYLDDDGDVNVPRRKQRSDDKDGKQSSIDIIHTLATPLPSVGLQVWRASFLLCDYLLHHTNALTGVTAVEFGAGTGISSIILARFASLVFITDHDNCVLQNCAENIQRNTCSSIGDVRIRRIDWSQPKILPVADALADEFSWTQRDMESVTDISVLLAADVVYDQETINLFFGCMREWLTGNRILLLCFEKRLVFTVDNLKEEYYGYDHLRQMFMDEGTFEKLPTSVSGDALFVGHQILSHDIPQYFQYERTKELELWEIRRAN